MTQLGHFFSTFRDDCSTCAPPLEHWHRTERIMTMMTMMMMMTMMTMTTMMMMIIIIIMMTMMTLRAAECWQRLSISWLGAGDGFATQVLWCLPGMVNHHWWCSCYYLLVIGDDNHYDDNDDYDHHHYWWCSSYLLVNGDDWWWQRKKRWRWWSIGWSLPWSKDLVSDVGDLLSLSLFFSIDLHLPQPIPPMCNLFYFFISFYIDLHPQINPSV